MIRSETFISEEFFLMGATCRGYPSLKMKNALPTASLLVYRLCDCTDLNLWFPAYTDHVTLLSFHL